MPRACQKWNRNRLQTTLVVLLVLASCFEWERHSAAAEPKLKNFVVILADDMGYNDTSFAGNATIRTPNIDRLAREGTRFSHFRVASPICSPSRASLMTGRYPQRTGVEQALGRESEEGLHREEITVGEYLKLQDDYAIGFIGKWHLGDQEYNVPWARGYETTACTLWGQTRTYFDPYVWSNSVHKQERGYLTHITTTAAIDFIDRHQDEKFLLWIAHQAPHAPKEAPAHRIRSAQSRQPGDREDPYRTANAIHNAMVEVIDDGVGRILDKLEELSIDQETLVIFLSDNGARPADSINHPFLHGKGAFSEGGMRVPFIAYCPGVVPKGEVSDAKITALDLFPTLCTLADVDLPNVVIDGRDISKALLGEELPPRSKPFFAVGTNPDQSVRSAAWWKHWKYMATRQYPEGRLYDLRKDERHPVHKTNPEIYQSLRAAHRDFEQALQDGVAIKPFPGANR